MSIWIHTPHQELVEKKLNGGVDMTGYDISGLAEKERVLDYGIRREIPGIWGGEYMGGMIYMVDSTISIHTNSTPALDGITSHLDMITAKYPCDQLPRRVLIMSFNLLLRAFQCPSIRCSRSM